MTRKCKYEIEYQRNSMWEIKRSGSVIFTSRMYPTCLLFLSAYLGKEIEHGTYKIFA